MEAALHTTEVSAAFDAASTNVAVVNRSRVGKLVIRGNDGLDLLHRLSTNDLLRASANSVTPTIFVTEKGRLIDYAVLVKSSMIMLLVSDGNESAVKSWIDKYTIMEDVTVETRTEDFGLISLVGPDAYLYAERVFGCSLQSGQVHEVTLPFSAVTLLCRSDFDVQRVDILVPSPETDNLWNHLLSASDNVPVPMDDVGYEVFRISRGIPKLGNEIREAFNPFEVGLRRAVSFRKGCYIGQEVIARLETYQKVQREPWGIVMSAEESPPREGARVVQNDAEIGILTSVSAATIRGKRCGIGILKKGHVRADDPIGIVGEGGACIGYCVKFPVIL